MAKRKKKTKKSLLQQNEKFLRKAFFVFGALCFVITGEYLIVKKRLNHLKDQNVSYEKERVKAREQKVLEQFYEDQQKIAREREVILHQKKKIRNFEVIRPQELGEAEPISPDWLKSSVRSGQGLASVKPKIAIIIDDMGFKRDALERLLALPVPVTFSFFPYAPKVREQAGVAFSRGREVMLHLPMQPKDIDKKPGGNMLTLSMNQKELGAALKQNLDSFDHYVAINNHMGSAFTEDKAAMTQVMQALKDRHVTFLDSMTTKKSVGLKVARSLKMPILKRDIFLDNIQTQKSILKQLKLAERKAKKAGMVVAIGHPYPETIKALESWASSVREKFDIVPISGVLRQKYRVG